MRNSTVTIALTGLLGLVLGMASPAARVDVKTDYDKTFDFRPVKTWAWCPANRAT